MLQPSFIPARSPAEDIAALFTPEEARRASEILCRALVAVQCDIPSQLALHGPHASNSSTYLRWQARNQTE